MENFTVSVTITDDSGQQVAVSSNTLAEFMAFTKKTGAPISALLDSMYNDAVNQAMPAINPDAQQLPPRRPGGHEFNR